MQDVRTNRSLSYEEQVLFERYHIVGYDTDAPGVRDGATLTSDDNQRSDGGEGLVGDTSGHCED